MEQNGGPIDRRTSQERRGHFARVVEKLLDFVIGFSLMEQRRSQKVLHGRTLLRIIVIVPLRQPQALTQKWLRSLRVIFHDQTSPEQPQTRQEPSSSSFRPGTIDGE